MRRACSSSEQSSMIGGRCGLLAWSFVVVCGGEFQADGLLEEETQQEMDDCSSPCEG